MNKYYIEQLKDIYQDMMNVAYREGNMKADFRHIKLRLKCIIDAMEASVAKSDRADHSG